MFKVQNATNLSWSNPEHTTFDCMVKFEEFDEAMPFGCVQSDHYAHSQELWQRAVVDGEFGPIAEYVSPTPVATEPQPTVIGAQTL